MDKLIDVQVNLEGLSETGNRLIKTIRDVVGMVYRPRQIVKLAEALSKADQLLASNPQAKDLLGRTVERWFTEEVRDQENMESVRSKALPHVTENAKPDSMNRDWITNFFNKCRMVSEDEAQELWARILAGEANAPGSFSKRTVNAIEDLDKTEANLFTNLCGFLCDLHYSPNSTLSVPVVFNRNDEIYNQNGINLGTLIQLDSIGFIKLSQDPDLPFTRGYAPPHVSYFDRQFTMSEPSPQLSRKELRTGQVELTTIGQELAPICGSKPLAGFFEYLTNQWKEYQPQEIRTR